jgi:beta-1,4-mannosyl-glycoprotein beta-1,4-N-acetylglucosaminyltransferase
VEARLTHTGHPKPLHFTEWRKESMWAGLEDTDKLSVSVANISHVGHEPWFNWGREIMQRSFINEMLRAWRAKDDDIVLSSDIDEIPRKTVVEDYIKQNRQDICSIEEKTYHYNLNTLLDTPTIDPKICRYRSAREIGVADLRYYHQIRPHAVKVIKDGGWHLSFMGGTDKIIEKMKAYAHYDDRDPNQQKYLTRENVEESVRAGKSVFMRDDIRYTRVNDFHDMPRHIMENFEQFVEKGWIVREQSKEGP